MRAIHRWGYLQFCTNIKHLKFLRYRNTLSPIHQFDEIERQIGYEHHINLESLDKRKFVISIFRALDTSLIIGIPYAIYTRNYIDLTKDYGR